MSYFLGFIFGTFVLATIAVASIMVYRDRQADASCFVANIVTICLIYIFGTTLLGHFFWGDKAALFTAEVPWRWVWGIMPLHAWVVATRYPIWKQCKKA